MKQFEAGSFFIGDPTLVFPDHYLMQISKDGTFRMTSKSNNFTVTASNGWEIEVYSTIAIIPVENLPAGINIDKKHIKRFAVPFQVDKSAGVMYIKVKNTQITIDTNPQYDFGDEDRLGEGYMDC